jgi:hypothetical protein
MWHSRRRGIARIGRYIGSFWLLQESLDQKESFYEEMPGLEGVFAQAAGFDA